MEIIYGYLTGTEFRQRVEAIVDAFAQMKHDLEREKRAYTKLWAMREKQLQQVIDNTIGMHGDLQGIVGKELSEIRGLDMLPDGSVAKELFE